MRNLIIGVINNYTYDKIEPWVVSLERTGYDGAKVLIAYNISKETTDRLEQKDITVFAFDKDLNGNCIYPEISGFSLMVERFAHIWYFLTNNEEKFGQVIITDVGDVVFQQNPFHNTQMKHIWRECLVGSENIRYEDEPWGKNNMVHSFGPMIYETVKENPIFCAGVIAGESNAITDLCLAIYLMCRGTPGHVQGGGGPDQAALNVLLSLQPYKMSVTKSYGSFVAHMGTSPQAVASGSGGAGEIYKDRLDEYQKLLIWNKETELRMDEDTNLIYVNGNLVDILHQYNRIPMWDLIIQEKYRELTHGHS
tara:strand:- start:35053 stop:35979 length:927 start_codon:yes stop_codon:yes gene_type:complete